MPVCPACGQDNPPLARFCMSCATPITAGPAPSGGARKVVTVLFCDVVGFTPLGERLDPESVRAVMSRFFDEMRGVIHRYGGTVEKYIGDAVMAVFGVPLLHEDDALRAVRAAAEMRRALAPLDADLERRWGATIQVRIGVNTGEVVVGDPASGRSLVVGDAVNVAARLEQSAMPGEILIGADTHALVRDQVRAEAGERLSLKGKAEAVTAYRLVDVDVEPADARRSQPALVDRVEEMQQLRAMFEETVTGGRASIVSVIGSAGVGKSRLGNEFVDEVAPTALVLRGRCLPYGEGITFWPVAEVLRQACGIAIDDERHRARSRIGSALAGAQDAEMIEERVAAVVGVGESGAGMQETFWAIRRFLERLASERPVVVVFDDIQWAEPTFLDLVEYLAGWTRDVPILILCLARPDLLDVRTSWGGGATGAMTLTLRPLTTSESEELIANILGTVRMQPSALARITEAAGGNPLFVEEMLRMLEDDGVLRRSGGGWQALGDLSRVAVPPTIQALIGARLDRLTPNERTVIRSAAVVGKEFWWGAVADLVPPHLRPHVGAHLQTLVRKELIRPGLSPLAGEDAFVFHHLLIQESAYLGTPKEIRAELHERFADWLEEHVGDRGAEYEELVGYHLEQAFRHREQLGPVSDADLGVAPRAAAHLAAAGRRALGLGDMAAAADLLGRAVALYPPDDPRALPLRADLAEALMEVDLPRAEQVLAEAAQQAELVGDRGVAAHVVVMRLLMEASTAPKERAGVARQQLESVIPVFEDLGDHLGLARAWRSIADVHWAEGRYADADGALRHAIEHARRAGAAWEEADALGQWAGCGVYGPNAVPDVVQRCHEIVETAKGNRVVEAWATRGLAHLAAMQGRFEEARGLAARSREMLEDLGLRLRAAFTSEAAGFIEHIAGDHAAAERALLSGFDARRETGEQGYLSTVAALLSHEIAEQGRLEEAERFIQIGMTAGAEDDVTTQVVWRMAQALVLAARGRPVDAEAIAREAISLADATDDLNMRADALMDLGVVIASAGRSAEAIEAWDRARGLYQRKGNVASVADADRRIAEARRGGRGG